MIIKVDLWRQPDRLPEELPEGGGKVIAVSFRELDQLKQQLFEYGTYPGTAGYDLGDVTFFSDGKVVKILELEDGPGGAVWMCRAAYHEDHVVRHLIDRRAYRRRLEKRLVQLRCDHDFNSRRCVKCNEPKPLKRPTCGSRPTTWTLRKPDGRVSRYKRSPRCRRRRGHDGDCSWADDPCCNKGPHWRQPAR